MGTTAIVAYPSWLSSRFANSAMCEHVFGTWNADVNVGAFQIGWTQPMKISDVESVVDGELLLEIDEIQTELTFAKIAWGTDKFHTVKVRGLQLDLHEKEGPTNIKEMIPIDPEANLALDISGADIQMRNPAGIVWGTIKDGSLRIEFKQEQGEPVMIIRPVELFVRSPMKIEILDHVPPYLKVFFDQPCVDATVTLRILNYKEKLQQENGLISKTELIIHELHIEKPEVRAAIVELIRKYSGLPASSDDLAIIHYSREGLKAKVDLVNESSFDKLADPKDQN
jgi:hypothetical protein